MKKHYKIITINGFRGVLMAIFIVLGLIAGFIISPAWVCMKLWNTFIVEYTAASPMNLYQGLLLWAVIALCLYALNNKQALIGFGTYPKLTPEQIKDIMKRAKMPDSQIISDLETLKNKLKIEPVDSIETALQEEKSNDNQKEIRG